MPDKPLVLVIDDETGSRESMAIALEKAGLAVRTFDDARKALEFLDENEARLAVCDLRMPGMDGLAFLQEIRERKIDLSIMLVTAYGSIESAVEAMAQAIASTPPLAPSRWPIMMARSRSKIVRILNSRNIRNFSGPRIWQSCACAIQSMTW